MSYIVLTVNLVSISMLVHWRQCATLSPCQPVANSSEPLRGVTDENNLFFIERDKTSSSRASSCAEWNQSTGWYRRFLLVCGRLASLAGHANEIGTEKPMKKRACLLHAVVFWGFEDTSQRRSQSQRWVNSWAFAWSQRALNLRDSCQGPRPKSKRPFIKKINTTATLLKEHENVVLWVRRERKKDLA